MKPVVALGFILSTALSLVAEPERNKGLSLHMLPERVAKISNEQGGFSVSSPAPNVQIPALNAKKVLEYFHRLPEEVRKNGIWVVYTHPSSYSEKEKKQLAELIQDSKSLEIPIFTCRASDLGKNLWKEGASVD